MTTIIKTTAIALAAATLITATACEASAASAMPVRTGGRISIYHYSKITFPVAPALKGGIGGRGNHHVSIATGPYFGGAAQLPAGTLSTVGGTCSCGR